MSPADDARLGRPTGILSAAPVAAFPPPPCNPVPEGEAIRILFVFAWLVVGGEETELRLLARALPPSRYRIEVVACFRKDGMPDQTQAQLTAAGISVDQTPYGLCFEDTVAYLAGKVPHYDLVISCQDVADIYPALERIPNRPPLIEHGGLVSEAEAGPKHFTHRYVGVCQTIRDAAAARMPGREAHALEIPSMVDLAEFDPARLTPELRAAMRAGLGVGPAAPLIGWVGRLDAKKNVGDFIAAAALVARECPEARFVIVGGPDAFMPEYAADLHRQASALGLAERVHFTGDRADVPALLAAMDVFVWLSKGEGMPHVIAEAGAAGLPVIATPDNGALQQIADGLTGLITPYHDPVAAAERILRLIHAPDLRAALGAALRAKVAREYSVEALAPRWAALIEEVAAERAPGRPEGLLPGFWMGGFECSSHRLRSGRRIDVIAATRHDTRAAEDYRELQGLGLGTVRDGLRWPMIETAPGRYDFSSWRPMLRAARAAGTTVVWDVMHYGWPDGLDIWRPAFVNRFAAFARAAALVMREEIEAPPIWCPVNEISFFSWGGGDAGYLNPFAHGRGYELKVQLARAAILAMEEMLDVDPRARFLHCEPAINVVCDPARPHDAPWAEGHRQAQFQAFDLIAGRSWPQIGGREALLDLIGVNYYFNNQWVHGGPVLDIGHPLYKPFRFMLVELAARYGRPVVIAETGIEGDRRPDWLAYVAGEVRAAMRMGVQMEGLCLYPVMDHPGWDDDRECPNGLISLHLENGRRRVNEPLAAELRRQQAALAGRMTLRATG